MFPGYTTNNPTEQGLSDAVFNGEGGLCRTALAPSVADLDNLSIGQPGRPIAFTARQSFGVFVDGFLSRPHEVRAHPGGVVIAAPERFRLGTRHMSVAHRTTPFGPHVVVIVGFRAQEQMAKARAGDPIDNVNAGFIVPHAWAEVADVEYAHSRRDRPEYLLKSPNVSPHAGPAMWPEVAVAATRAGLPQPATIGTINLRPEPLVIRGPGVYSAWHLGNLQVSAPRGISSTAGASCCLNYTRYQIGGTHE